MFCIQKLLRLSQILLCLFFSRFRTFLGDRKVSKIQEGNSHFKLTVLLSLHHFDRLTEKLLRLPVLFHLRQRERHIVIQPTEASVVRPEV